MKNACISINLKGFYMLTTKRTLKRTCKLYNKHCLERRNNSIKSNVYE